MKAAPIVLFILLNYFAVSAQEAPVEQPASFQWTEKERMTYLENRADSSTWNTDYLNLDRQIIGLDIFGPFEIGAFPVPRYELAGGTNQIAVGNKPGLIDLNGKKLHMNSFYVSKNPVNEAYLGEKENEIFFHIIVQTDVADAAADGGILSRNHPDYLGQGFVQTSMSNVEYAAFITAERASYAIVNARLFDLNYGKTILIAPQEDGTLRSLQIKSPELSSDDILEYSLALLNKDAIKAFFR